MCLSANEVMTARVDFAQPASAADLDASYEFGQRQCDGTGLRRLNDDIQIMLKRA